MEFRFNEVEEVIEDIRNGRMVIIVDDETRENEGDLFVAGELVTPEHINFMAKYGRGLICAPVSPEVAERLNLTAMTTENTEHYGTWFTISVDAREGITTGISAYDRARTIRVLADPSSKPSDLVRPGHIFPLKARPNGLLERQGHTEAAVELLQIAGLYPVGVICEIMKEDGTMARLPDLFNFAKQHNLKIISISKIFKHILKTRKIVEKIAETNLPTKFGLFRMIVYKDKLENNEHVALVKGNLANKKGVLTRIHSSCLTSEVFGSLKCDCRDQLHTSMQIIEKNGEGVVVYLSQEGRGIGLPNKVNAYFLQDLGFDTADANRVLGFEEDMRDYAIAVQILKDLGVLSIRLLTNNPRKIKGVEEYGIKVEERIPLQIAPNEYNKNYLKAKKEKLGHLLDI